MTSTTHLDAPVDTPAPLTVAARRRLLCELADLYASEQSYGGERPITEALPTLLHAVRTWHLPLNVAVGLFDEFARARAVTSRACSTSTEMDAADRRAQRLLDQLVGEA